MFIMINFLHDSYRKFIFFLIQQRLERTSPRPGIWGAFGRWLHLPFGWVAGGLDDDEMKVLLTIAKEWGIANDEV